MTSSVHAARTGRVSLVGAGPGDPDLITVRGRRLLETADAIYYDHLAPVSLLDLAKRGAKTVYVGKKRSERVYSQDEISGMLIAEARSGSEVVRLKGGDAYIFGRGGEEAEALFEADVPFIVVPGVTSAVGVAAYAGIPLTHRRETSTLHFVTGHEPDQIDWAAFAGSGTLVIFMGLTTFSAIAERLVQAGRSPDTPAAAVRWGTRGDQRTVEGTIENLAAKIRRARLKPPALVVVGEVVSLRGRLNWFERLPLFNRRVVVTRARDQAASLAGRLRELGAEVVSLPAIEIQPPETWEPLDRAIGELERYDWLIFTSANGVRFFIERLDHGTRDLRNLRAKICAIGPATAQALGALHLKVDRLPREYVAESLLEAFGDDEIEGQRILIPRAKAARDLIPAELEKRGAKVDVVAAYQTVIPPDSASRVSEVFEAGRKPDWITFTSSSTVKHFLEFLPNKLPQGVRVASIGPITSATAKQLGLNVDVEAAEYTTAGLVRAIVEAEVQQKGTSEADS